MDAFFDGVMVNAEDAALRANRLALLAAAACGDEPRGRSVEAGGLTPVRGAIGDGPSLPPPADLMSPPGGRPIHPRPFLAPAAQRLVIVGRDGILNVYRDDHVKSPNEWQPLKGAGGGGGLNQAGWHVVVATNQSGIGRGMIDMASVNAVHST